MSRLPTEWCVPCIEGQRRMLLVFWNLSLFFHREEGIQHCASYCFVHSPLDKLHGSFEMPLGPSFAGDEYRIVGVLTMPLRGENEVFLLLLHSVVFCCCLTLGLLLESLQIWLPSWWVSLDSIRTCVLFSCALQVMYADCSATVIRC